MQRPESSTLTLTWHAGLYVPWIILLACQVRVTVGQLARSLLFCLCDVFRALIYLPCVLVVCVPRSHNCFRSAVRVFIPFADLSFCVLLMSLQSHTISGTLRALLSGIFLQMKDVVNRCLQFGLVSIDTL